MEAVPGGAWPGLQAILAGWFGIFSVDHERVERLKIYVANQKEHHSKRTTDDRYEWRRAIFGGDEL
jgi:hypothetical protein